MNLHGIVFGAIGSINPNVPATIQASQGSVTQPDGSRVPAYAAPVTMMAQVQALTQRDLAQLDGLNVQGATHTLYISDPINGVLRSTNKGGDLVTIGAQTYLVTAILEQWDSWTKAAVTLQNGG